MSYFQKSVTFGVKRDIQTKMENKLDFMLTYNPGHNILELYNILVEIRFTTSKTKLDI